MSRFREIGKYGNTYVIKLKPQDIIDKKLIIGDEIDIDDCEINKASKEKSKNWKKN